MYDLYLYGVCFVPPYSRNALRSSPCSAPCASYLLRKRALYNDMSRLFRTFMYIDIYQFQFDRLSLKVSSLSHRYTCCAGYMPCSGSCGESKCPQLCLASEVRILIFLKLLSFFFFFYIYITVVSLEISFSASECFMEHMHKISPHILLLLSETSLLDRRDL